MPPSVLCECRLRLYRQSLKMKPRERWTAFVISVGLVAITWCVFARALSFGFVNFDDFDYVVRNPHVNHGLTSEGIRWAFTHVHAGNWHPLTWISHMLDCQFFELDPRAHHFTNL